MDPASESHSEVKVNSASESHTEATVDPPAYRKAKVDPASETQAEAKVNPASESHSEVKVNSASVSHTEATVNPRAYREAKVDPHFISVMCHHFDGVFMALDSGRPEHPSTTGIFFRQIGPEVDEVRDLRRLSISLTTQAAPRIENSTNGEHNEIYFKIDQHTPAYVFSNTAAYFIIMEGSFYFGGQDTCVRDHLHCNHCCSYCSCTRGESCQQIEGLC